MSLNLAGLLSGYSSGLDAARDFSAYEPRPVDYKSMSEGEFDAFLHRLDTEGNGVLMNPSPLGDEYDKIVFARARAMQGVRHGEDIPEYIVPMPNGQIFVGGGPPLNRYG